MKNWLKSPIILETFLTPQAKCEQYYTFEEKEKRNYHSSQEQIHSF